MRTEKAELERLNSDVKLQLNDIQKFSGDRDGLLQEVKGMLYKIILMLVAYASSTVALYALM